MKEIEKNVAVTYWTYATEEIIPRPDTIRVQNIKNRH